MSGIKLNDGGGLYDGGGLCDSLIIDCNNLIKQTVSGNYIQACGIIVQMVQKLTKLKDGIKSDMESKDRTIEELKRINATITEQQTGLPVDGGN